MRTHFTSWTMLSLSPTARAIIALALSARLPTFLAHDVTGVDPITSCRETEQVERGPFGPPELV